MDSLVIWLSTPQFTVGLIVRDGIIVGTPPIARRWAMGRSARQVWNDAASRPGVIVKWIP